MGGARKDRGHHENGLSTRIVHSQYNRYHHNKGTSSATGRLKTHALVLLMIVVSLGFLLARFGRQEESSRDLKQHENGHYLYKSSSWFAGDSRVLRESEEENTQVESRFETKSDHQDSLEVKQTAEVKEPRNKKYTTTGGSVKSGLKKDVGKLLLATHGRLMWYYYGDDERLEVIHEHKGIYYGGFPGEDVDENGMPKTLWIVSRPHNWRPKNAEEWMIEVDAKTGKELKQVPLKSKFTHDVVRRGERVYVADTGEGHIVELEFPTMKEVRRMELFSMKEHVNTLSPTSDRYLWAMLHNLGPSILVRVDLESERIVDKIEKVGLKSHGAVQLHDDRMLFLDSDHASLAEINLGSRKIKQLWKAEGRENLYLKGLCVVDNIAFFGIAESQPRQSRADEDLSCELAAFDLIADKLLWRRKLPTKGLLNVVAAPHLSTESTAKQVILEDSHQGYRFSQSYQAALRNDGGDVRKADDLKVVLVYENDLDSPDTLRKKATRADDLPLMKNLPKDDPILKYPPRIGGYWDSGYPQIDNSAKTTHSGFDTGVQLLLYREDKLKDLKGYLLEMPESNWDEEEQRKSNAFLEGRSKNLNQFKPGTSSIHLMFSDQNGDNVFEYPWYKEKFAKYLDPILERLLGKDVDNIIRMQFALMPAGTHIKPHVDNGGYSKSGHRIHFVVASSPDVSFQVCHLQECIKLHTEEGTVFELNNRLQHFVDNEGTSARIHLVVDILEEPRKRKILRKGQYKEAQVEFSRLPAAVYAMALSFSRVHWTNRQPHFDQWAPQKHIKIMNAPSSSRLSQIGPMRCGALPQISDPIKVVGMGSAGMDYLAEVASFPKPDDKMRTENLELQGGGNCGNALTAVARLGLKPVIVSKIGSDSVGDAIISEFEEDGVSTNYLLRSKSGKSPFTYIIVDRETNTRTCIHTPGEPFHEDEMTTGLVNEILDDASVVYFDGRLAEAAAILAEGARERGIPVLVEAERLRPGLDVLLKYADFVVTSAYFPRDFTGKGNLDEAMITMSMQLPHVKWIATTLGSKGALLLERMTREEAFGDPSAVQVRDEKLVSDLFNEAKSIREASQNTSTRSSVNAGTFTIFTRSIASSGAFYLDGTGPLGKSQSEEERSIAQQAAIQAALMNADSKNAKGYEGASDLKPEATDSQQVCYYLTAIESADIPPDQIVDTTGAGDAFIGSMVYSVAMGLPPIKGCELGSLVAACKCTMLGARPGLPTMESIQLN